MLDHPAESVPSAAKSAYNQAMRTPFRSFAPILACLASLSACLGSNAGVDEAPETIASVALIPPQGELAMPDEQGCWEGNDSVLCPIIITQDGKLTYRGVEIAPEASIALEEQWRGLGYEILGVATHPLAESVDVVGHLSRIDAAIPNPSSSEGDTYTIADPFARFALVELEQRYGGLVKQRDLDAAAEFDERGFLGPVGDYEYPVWVGYSTTRNACVLKTDDLTVSSKELNDRAFQKLDGIVVSAGGAEAILDSPEFFASLFARIQADPGTPWQCVAGAYYETMRAGWPEVRIEITKVE